MKPSVLFLLLLSPFFLYAQQTPPPKSQGIGIGIRGGFNFANVTNASQVNGSSLAGYHFAVFLAPHTKGVIGSRTELIYSRSGYNYASDTSQGAVNLDYIMLAQYMAIHITKYFEIDLGGQTGYLLNAKVDSNKQVNYGSPQANSIMSYYNRLDYGFGAGVEVHPFMGIVVGARYNISLNSLYKTDLSSFSQGGNGQPPSFVPSSGSVNLKNNVIQLYAGYRF
ncbi:MAG TPA: outer membrane beta-barrel protein [Puia sp.]|nr:outer membrane beta-barrel protein [Puia sp.]